MSMLDPPGKGGKVLSTPPAPGPEEAWTSSNCCLTTRPLPQLPAKEPRAAGAASLMERSGLMKETRRHFVK